MSESVDTTPKRKSESILKYFGKKSRNNIDDWRSGCSTIPEILSKAREDQLYTDIEFLIGPSEVVFAAHKLILACGSPVFEKMFYGPMAETTDRIKIEEDDPQPFRMLLNYLYGKEKDIQIESFECALEYYTIGDKYLVPGIQRSVEKWIETSKVNEELFWETIRNDLFSVPLFTKKLNSYMQVKTEDILNSKDFLNAPENIVETILQMDNLNVSELKLLQHLTKWGYSNFGSETMSKQRLSLYKYIRFSTLSNYEFCSFTDSFPHAIDSESCFKIMKHLCDRSTYELPNWCSANRKGRYKKSSFYDDFVANYVPNESDDDY